VDGLDLGRIHDHTHPGYGVPEVGDSVTPKEDLERLTKRRCWRSTVRTTRRCRRWFAQEALYIKISSKKASTNVHERLERGRDVA
jgi:hypothetical protein